MAAVEIAGLAKCFGASAALHATDLAVQDGEFLVLVGPSGCGKSTLLRLIAGLDTPSAGRVLIDGRDVTDAAPSDRGIAMVFQSYALYPQMTVAQNIAFPLQVAGLSRREIGERVAEVAAMLDLSALLERRPRALSGGQRQRVSIARAVVRRPRVLLLDEPLSNLDSGLRARMRHEFARLHQRLGTTMIYVTHDQLEAMTLANRIAVMSEGRVEQVGPPLTVYRHPASIAVAQAIGSPGMNLLAVTIVSGGEGGAVVRLPGGEQLHTGARVPNSDINAPATLGVRPEHLFPAAAGPFAGPVELFERLGPLSFAHLGESGAAGTIVAQLPGDQSVALGAILRVAVDPCDAHVFAVNGRAYPPRVGV